MGRLRNKIAAQRIFLEIFISSCEKMAAIIARIFPIFIVLIFANIATADCFEAYKAEIARENITKDKKAYREMDTILRNTQDSKYLQHWLTLLDKHNADAQKYKLKAKEAGIALNFLNEQNAFCLNAKPLKVKAAAINFFNLLKIYEGEIIDKIQATKKQAYVHIDSIKKLLNYYNKILKSSNIKHQLNYYRKSLTHQHVETFLPNLNIEISLLISLLSVFNSIYLHQLQQDKIDEYLSQNWQLLRNNCLVKMSNNSVDLPTIERLLAILRNGKNLDKKSFQILSSFNLLQLKVYERLIKNKFKNSLELASFIIEPNAYKALKYSLEYGLLKPTDTNFFQQISNIHTIDEFNSFISLHFENPTQIIAKKKGTYNAEITPELEPIYLKELELINNAFIVAYHTIPDTNINSALPIYIFQAYIAEILYGIKMDMLPRFRQQPFEIWPTVSSLKNVYTNDHDPRWRDIGIAASPSIFSDTESPPYKDFQYGYKGSGAAKPSCAHLIELILEDLGFDSNEARGLANSISKAGIADFLSAGGSILQVGIKYSLACENMFLCRGWAGIEACDKEMLFTLNSGKLALNHQVRLIMNPSIFLNPKKSAIIHYPYHQENFQRAKQSFINFLDKNFRPLLLKKLQNTAAREIMLKNLMVKKLVPIEAD